MLKVISRNVDLLSNNEKKNDVRRTRLGSHSLSVVATTVAGWLIGFSSAPAVILLYFVQANNMRCEQICKYSRSRVSFVGCSWSFGAT